MQKKPCSIFCDLHVLLQSSAQNHPTGKTNSGSGVADWGCFRPSRSDIPCNAGSCRVVEGFERVPQEFRVVNQSSEASCAKRLSRIYPCSGHVFKHPSAIQCAVVRS